MSTPSGVRVPHITLYYGHETYSFIAHALLRHVNLPFTPVRTRDTGDGHEAFDGSISKEEYRRIIHPKGFVPALALEDEDGKTVVITETPAIIVLICNLADERAAALMGSTPLDKARVQYWLTWALDSLHDAFCLIWRPMRYVDTKDEVVHKHMIDKGYGMMLNDFALVDEHLKREGRPHMVGGRLTAADFNLYIFYRWTARLKLDMVKAYPYYTNFVKTMETLPAIQATLRAEELQPAVAK